MTATMAQVSTPLSVSALPGHARLAEAALVVIAFCANWCGTCRDFRPVLERIAHERPQILFAWADIEDDAALVGDIDVENFPSLAVFRAGEVLHYGVSLPHEAVVARMIDALAAHGVRAQAGVPPEVSALASRLAA